MAIETKRTGDTAMTQTASWNDRTCSEQELQAALDFWRRFHTVGSRRRVRAAVRYFRQWH